MTIPFAHHPICTKRDSFTRKDAVGRAGLEPATPIKSPTQDQTEGNQDDPSREKSDG